MYKNTKNIIESNFFYIDSDTCNITNSTLFGYIIQPEGIISQNNIGNDFCFDMQKMTCGAFVYIDNSDNEIKIYQDFNGSFGLYVYKNSDGFFGISNSFIHLVNKIKNKHKLSFNYDYAYTFYNCDVCHSNYSDTMINEISLLPKDCFVSISKNTKNLCVNNIDWKLNSIDLDSKEGIDTLDKWCLKWTSIFRKLKSTSNNLSVDLSGGFDSRMVFSLFVNSGIDLNTIKVHTIEDDLHVHGEDYKIASKIAKHYGFSLNNNSHITKKVTPMDNVEGALALSLYPKMCFHKQMYIKNYYAEEPQYTITGAGGECSRAYWVYSYKEYLHKQIDKCKDSQPFIKNYIEREFFKIFSEISNRYNINSNDPQLSEILYRDARSRNHFGKTAVAHYFSNEYQLWPMLDPLILKLKKNTARCKDKNLLMATIFDRYAPDLLLFEFEGQRFIDKATIAEAKSLNAKYGKYTHGFVDIIGLIKQQSVTVTNELNDVLPYARTDLELSIRNIVTSIEFKKFCNSYFYDGIWEDSEKFYTDVKYHPLQQYYCLLSMVKIMKDVIISQTPNLGFDFNSSVKNHRSLIDDLLFDKNKFHKEQMFNKILRLLMPIRIDFKNFGKDNKLEISSEARVSTPKYFCDELGTGYVLESDKNIDAIHIKVIHDGLLKMYFKASDRRIDGSRYPLFVDYESIKINGNELLKSTLSSWHDSPYKYEMNVKHGEKVTVEVKCKCHRYPLIELINILEKLGGISLESIDAAQLMLFCDIKK